MTVLRTKPRAAAVLPALLLLSSSCGRTPAPAAPPPAPVSIAAVEQKAVPVELHAIGNVAATSVVEIRSRVAGELLALHFKEGELVNKGDVLFTIDPRAFAVALDGAEAKLARDLVIAENARKEAERYTGLVEKEYVTREQYERSLATAAAAEAQVKGDRAEVENARLQLSYGTIRAPISGRVGDVLLHAGNLIKADDDKPLLVLRQMRPVFVTFAVPEKDLPRIRERAAGRVLEVRATPPGTSEDRRGTLTFMDNTVNTETGTIDLKATFPNQDDALWPGQFVDIVLTLGTENAVLTVPSEAVQNGQQGAFVFVVKDDSTVESRPVEVARTFGSETVIAKGVVSGEKVVTEGQLRLVPGAKVAPKGSS